MIRAELKALQLKTRQLLWLSQAVVECSLAGHQPRPRSC